MTNLITILISILTLASMHGFSFSTCYGVCLNPAGDGVIISDYDYSGQNYINYSDKLNGQTPEAGAIIKTVCIEVNGECEYRIDTVVEGDKKIHNNNMNIDIQDGNSNLNFEIPLTNYENASLIVDRIEDNNIAVLEYADAFGEIWTYNAENNGYYEGQELELEYVFQNEKNVIFGLSDGQKIIIEL